MRNNHSNKWTDADVEAHWDRVAHIYVQENEKVKEAFKAAIEKVAGSS